MMKPTQRPSLESGAPGRIRSLFAAAFSALFFVSCSTYNPERSFKHELEATPGDGLFIAGVPGIDRLDRKETIAALNSPVIFWNKEPLDRSGAGGLLTKNKEVSPVDDVIQDELVKRGLWSFAFYGGMQAVEGRLRQKIPLLVIVQDNPLNIESRRYMVLIGFNARAQTLLAHEGGPNPGVYTYQRFQKIWRPTKNWVMIICPPEKVEWELSVLEHAALARFQGRSGDWEGAIRDYDRAISLDPYNMDLQLAKGDALFRSGDSLSALSLYRYVLNKNDLNARAANNLAFVLADTNADLNEAENLSRRSLTIEPSNPLYLETLGYVLIKAGRFREAAQVLSKAHRRMDSIPVNEQRQIMRRLIFAYNKSNQPHLARQLLLEYQLKDTDFSPDLEDEAVESK